MSTRKTIYLDSNIYLAIAKKELGHLRIENKLKILKQKSIIFPHAPPHAEEAIARMELDANSAANFIRLVRRFNKGFGYFPGFMNAEDTEAELRRVSDAGHSDPRLRSYARILSENLDLHRQNKISNDRLATRLEEDDFIHCMARCAERPELTDFAIDSEVRHMGRRSEGSIRSNNDDLEAPNLAAENFEDLRRRYGLKPKMLANIPPTEIFNDINFHRFAADRLKEDNFNIHQLPSPDQLMEYHQSRAFVICKLLNIMEKAGYRQETKDSRPNLTRRMHDVSHAIYASAAQYFVTNDRRLAAKTTAAYHLLGLKTKVLGKEEFLQY